MNIFGKSYVHAIAVSLSTVLLASCSSERVASGPDVIAKWKACTESTEGLKNAGRTALEGSSWAEGKLIVNIKDNEYCGGTRIANPRYTVNGKLVQLSWQWELGPDKAVTACTCDFSVRFELTNVPAGDYQIQLARVR